MNKRAQLSDTAIIILFFITLIISGILAIKEVQTEKEKVCNWKEKTFHNCKELEINTTIENLNLTIAELSHITDLEYKSLIKGDKLIASIKQKDWPYRQEIIIFENNSRELKYQ